MNTQYQHPSNTIQQDETDQEVNLLGLVDVILEGRWLIAIVTGTILLIAIAYCVLTSPIYEANLLIQVEKNQDGANSLIGEMSSLFNLESPATAEIEILKSRFVVGSAADELRLYLSAKPDYLPIIGRWLSKQATELSSPMEGYVSGTESILLNQLEVPDSLEGKKLKLISTDTGYDLLGPDDEVLIKSGTVSKNIVFTYQGKNGVLNVKEIEAKKGARFYIKRDSRLQTINSLQTDLDIYEKGKQSGMISASLKGISPEQTAEILNSIGNAYVDQNIRRKAAEAEKSLQFLDKFLPELRDQMTHSETEYTKFRDTHGTFNLTAEGEMSLQASADLQTRLLELQQKRRELIPRFTESHPTIKTIDDQIAAIKRSLGDIETNVRKMPDIQQKLLSLMRNVQVDSDMYVNLLNSAQQLRLVKAGKVGNVRIVDQAVTPEIPIAPRKGLILITSLLIGLILGTVLTFIRNLMRSGIEDTGEIESRLGLHVFSTIPHSKMQKELYDQIGNGTKGSHLLAANSPQDNAIESLRGLRTTLQFATLDSKNKLVILTGATPGIGKSFISANFAYVLASMGKRVLLIDADLRKGYLNQYFSLPRSGGFSEVLSDSKTLEQCIHHEVFPNLDFISTGIIPPNSAELLLSQKCSQILETVSKDYDHVLIDTAPILPVADALALVRHAHTIFLIAKAGVTSITELEEASKRISTSGGKPTGVIFNDVQPSAHRYGSKYGTYRYTQYSYTSSSE